MDLALQLRLALQAAHYPTPTAPWLTALLGTRHPPPPLQSLVATAKARLLAADLTTPALLDPAHAAAFPPDLAAPTTAARTLAADVHVQVADVENLSRSRWEQVEALEAIERGEGTRGREIIRLPTNDAADDTLGHDLGDTATTQQPQQPPTRASAAAAGNATHRLVLQDCRGQNVYAMELTRIERIGVGVTAIGEKMLIRRGTRVARGTLLLTPENCVVLGGKIEAWQRPWVEGRLTRLREAVGSDAGSGP
ncbi:RecQ-mediated genome instability protein 1 like [Verticillium longisporum]